MSYSARPVSENHILELLNVAVWAPNDGMREPWRFIFIGSDNTDMLSDLQDQAPAYLILVIKEDQDPQREEDYGKAPHAKFPTACSGSHAPCTNDDE